MICPASRPSAHRLFGTFAGHAGANESTPGCTKRTASSRFRASRAAPGAKLRAIGMVALLGGLSTARAPAKPSPPPAAQRRARPEAGPPHPRRAVRLRETLHRLDHARVSSEAERPRERNTTRSLTPRVKEGSPGVLRQGVLKDNMVISTGSGLYVALLSTANTSEREDPRPGRFRCVQAEYGKGHMYRKSEGRRR